jgi:hypothetical protein
LAQVKCHDEQHRAGAVLLEPQELGLCVSGQKDGIDAVEKN